jgi:hypothetical protein
MLSVDFDEQNRIISKWVPKVRNALRSNVIRFTHGKTKSFVIRGNQKEGKLLPSIKSNTQKDFDIIETVSYSFERHGVFIHKGVGRGYKASSGFVIRAAKGPQTNPRVPQQWFNPVLDKYIPELAIEIAMINADVAVNATRMKIN